MIRLKHYLLLIQNIAYVRLDTRCVHTLNGMQIVLDQDEIELVVEKIYAYYGLAMPAGVAAKIGAESGVPAAKA